MFYLYRVSYLWYTLIGVLTAISVGLAVSFLTGANKAQDVDPRLLSPIIRRFVSCDTAKQNKGGESHELKSVQKKLLPPSAN